jgi:glycosyltransferase involved in cell wall biosynthesis
MLIDRIDILLSTFNGDLYISEQINSLLSQNYDNWRLLIRDDGSSDGTVSIVESYQNKFPDKIEIAKDSGENIGPCKSFERLLMTSNSPYVMFCDQDDVWLPDKILLSLQAMKNAEKDCEGAIMVFTDLKIVDQKLQLLHDSYLRFMNISSRYSNNPYYIVHNCPVNACTVMLNNHARENSIPFGKNALMHDWWCAVICGFSGRIVFVDESTILYRQHTGSVFGAPERPDKVFPIFMYSVRFVFRILFDFRSIKRSIDNHHDKICQALEAGRKTGFKFKIIRYFIELFLGKYWLPFFGRIVPSFREKMWRYP